MMKNYFIISLTILPLLFFGTMHYRSTNVPNDIPINTQQPVPQQTKSLFSDIGLATNTGKSLIPLDEVLGGGPAKDGIPSLTNPKYIPANTVQDVPEDSLGVLIVGDGIARFYPYTVLVWHEIVNDTIDGIDIAVTFCPLCGSAIAFERNHEDVTHEFGVSGKLWQSNLLMYDRGTESLWSQIEGRAVVGELIGAELKVFPSQLVTFAEAKAIDPELEVLSSDTGFNRQYGFYPYGDYDDTEQLIFPVNNLDVSLPAKTLMYASVIGEEAVAFNRERLLEARSATLETSLGIITASVSENNTILLTDAAGTSYPGYVTMWFSWANHNNGPVWK